MGRDLRAPLGLLLWAMALLTACTAQERTKDLDCDPIAPTPCECPDGRPGLQLCDVPTERSCLCDDGGLDDAQPSDAQLGDAGPDAGELCTDDTRREVDCPGDGMRLDVCIDGDWRLGPCLVCDEGAVRSRPCGLNDNGTASSVCQGPRWSEWGACRDPDVCLNGVLDVGSCGPNDEGLIDRRCEDGQWRSSGVCQMPPGDCQPGEDQWLRCGPGLQGSRTRECLDGAWSPWTACIHPEGCADGEVREQFCPALDRWGVQTCETGEWRPEDPCDAPRSCALGDLERRPCGRNDRGISVRRCEPSGWADWGQCDDPDRCIDGEEDQVDCGFGGIQARLCVEGRWQDQGRCEGLICPDGRRPPCMVNGNLCPEPRVSRPRLQVLPLDTIALDAGPSVDADGPTGRPVSYSWVVVQAPPGSGRLLFEQFFNPNRPQNGGLPDNVRTPSAVFFADVAGDYVIELLVTDVEGLEAPSVDCPGIVGRVEITARPTGDIHIELVWDTPTDDDLSDADGTDVDLHVLHPLGRAWNSTPLDCYYNNTNPDWGLPGPEGDPRLDIDDVNGAGPETVTIIDPQSTQPFGPTGYTVGVHYFRAERSNDPGSFGASLATLRIRYDGELVAQMERQLLRTGNFWEPVRLLWGPQEQRPVQIDRYYERTP